MNPEMMSSDAGPNPGIGAALLAALLLLCLGGCGARPDPPDPDVGSMEPRVAELLGQSRRDVLRDGESADAWGRFGGALHVHRLLAEATECYRKAAELAPGDFRWAYLLAVVREADGAPIEEVTQLFEVASRLRPDYAPAQLRLGLALSRRGEFAEARAMLHRAADLDPASPMAQRALGQALLALGETEEAIFPLARAARLQPRDGAVYSTMAQAYTQLGETELADEAAARARRLSPIHAFADPLYDEAVTALGRSASLGVTRVQRLIRRGELDAADAELAEMLAVRPDDPDIHYLMGLVAVHRQRTDEASAHLNRALELNADHVRALGELAGLLEAQGRVDDALVHRRRAQELVPRDPALIVALAATLNAKGDLDGVIQAFEMLAEVEPELPGVQVDLGTAWARNGDLDRATSHFERALQLDPDHANAHYRLGVVLEAVDRPDEAIEHYRTSVKIDSTNPALHRLQALVPGTTGRPAPAPKPPRQEFREISRQIYGGHNLYLGRARLDEQRQRMAGLDSPSVDDHVRLSRLLLEAGEVETAVAEVEKAMALLGPRPPSAELLRFRGLVYMRQSEVQNCVLRHNKDCCIFPLAGGGVHEDREPARNARESYERVLQLEPGDLRSRWLLNVMAMALGEYPGQVPEALRLPPESFAADHDVGRFFDIAPALGIDSFNLCGGAITDDFDGDGMLDIVTSTYDPDGPLAFFRNDGRGGFEDRSSSSGLDRQFGGLNIVGADYDNDGDPDVLVLRGAWLFDDGQIRNSLVRNNGDGTFTDVTYEAGLAYPRYPTQAAAWGDFDNDGDLDLFVCNESRKHDPINKADFPAQLFINRGDGTFTDVARRAGVTNDYYCKGVAAGDYDNDGDLDLYLSNIHENRLYRNNGDGSFTDVAPQAGVTEPSGRSFAPWFFDYDNDGWLDIFVSAFDATIGDLAAESLGLPHSGHLPRLYRNDGDGTFTDVMPQVGLDHVYLPMGANFGDIDNDGWLDIYLATGDPNFETLMPNVMLRNDGGRRFQNVTASGGFGHLQKGHGVAFADLDNDGDQDLYHQLGGFYPGDRFHNALFENPGHGNHWLVLELVGVASNRAGYGARIRIVIDTPRGEREIHRAVGSVSSFGGSPRRQEIGLGDATAIKLVEVRWPVSRTRQLLESVDMDVMLRITEDRQQVERVALQRVELRRE